MATDKEASCYSCSSDPNFAIICSFLDKFSSQCGITYPSFGELQDMLEDTQEVSQVLIDLHVKLLRKARKSFTADKWEKALAKFCHTYSQQDGWELERFGYKKSRLEVKVKLLKVLLETQFDVNAKFKAEVNKVTPEDLRLQPLGRDQTGLTYWCQFDPSSNVRVYREDVDDETWELVAKDRNGLVKLIDSLSHGEGQEELNNILNEDSMSQDIEKPITDTGQNKNDDEKEDESGEDTEDEEKEEEGDVADDEGDVADENGDAVDDEELDEEPDEEDGNEDEEEEEGEEDGENLQGEPKSLTKTNQEDQNKKSENITEDNGITHSSDTNGSNLSGVDLSVKSEPRPYIPSSNHQQGNFYMVPDRDPMPETADILTQMSAKFNEKNANNVSMNLSMKAKTNDTSEPGTINLVKKRDREGELKVAPISLNLVKGEYELKRDIQRNNEPVTLNLTSKGKIPDEIGIINIPKRPKYDGNEQTESMNLSVRPKLESNVINGKSGGINLIIKPIPEDITNKRLPVVDQNEPLPLVTSSAKARDDGDYDEDYLDYESEVSDEIEEPVQYFSGEGSGAECDLGNLGISCGQEEEKINDVPACGEVIEEPVLYIYGHGSGAECDVGNPKRLFEIPSSSRHSDNEDTLFSSVIEEPVQYVRGSGSGVDCGVGSPRHLRDESLLRSSDTIATMGLECSLRNLSLQQYEPNFSDVIEEPVMFVQGCGYGYDCQTGNSDEKDETCKEENSLEERSVLPDSSSICSNDKECLKADENSSNSIDLSSSKKLRNSPDESGLKPPSEIEPIQENIPMKDKPPDLKQESSELKIKTNCLSENCETENSLNPNETKSNCSDNNSISSISSSTPSQRLNNDASSSSGSNSAHLLLENKNPILVKSSTKITDIESLDDSIKSNNDESVRKNNGVGKRSRVTNRSKSNGEDVNLTGEKIQKDSEKNSVNSSKVKKRRDSKQTSSNRNENGPVVGDNVESDTLEKDEENSVNSDTIASDKQDNESETSNKKASKRKNVMLTNIIEVCLDNKSGLDNCNSDSKEEAYAKYNDLFSAKNITTPSSSKSSNDEDDSSENADVQINCLHLDKQSDSSLSLKKDNCYKDIKCKKDDGVKCKEEAGVKCKENDAVKCKENDGVECKENDGVKCKENDGIKCIKDDCVLEKEKDEVGAKCKENDGVKCKKDDCVLKKEKDEVGVKCKENDSVKCKKDDCVLKKEKDEVGVKCKDEDSILKKEKDTKIKDEISVKCKEEDSVLKKEKDTKIKDEVSVKCVEEDTVLKKEKDAKIKDEVGVECKEEDGVKHRVEEDVKSKQNDDENNKKDNTKNNKEDIIESKEVDDAKIKKEEDKKPKDFSKPEGSETKTNIKEKSTDSNKETEKKEENITEKHKDSEKPISQASRGRKSRTNSLNDEKERDIPSKKAKTEEADIKPTRRSTRRNNRSTSQSDSKGEEEKVKSVEGKEESDNKNEADNTETKASKTLSTLSMDTTLEENPVLEKSLPLKNQSRKRRSSMRISRSEDEDTAPVDEEEEAGGKKPRLRGKTKKGKVRGNVPASRPAAEASSSDEENKEEKDQKEESESKLKDKGRPIQKLRRRAAIAAAHAVVETIKKRTPPKSKKVEKSEEDTDKSNKKKSTPKKADKSPKKADKSPKKGKVEKRNKNQDVVKKSDVKKQAKQETSKKNEKKGSKPPSEIAMKQKKPSKDKKKEDSEEESEEEEEEDNKDDQVEEDNTDDQVEEENKGEIKENKVNKDHKKEEEEDDEEEEDETKNDKEVKKPKVNKEIKKTKDDDKSSKEEKPKERRSRGMKKKTLLGLTEWDMIHSKASPVNAEDDGSRVRASRRIAQIKIKEQAERRAIEEATIMSIKDMKKTIKKDDKKDSPKKKKKGRKEKGSEDEDASFKEPPKEEKRGRKKKKRKDRLNYDENRPWRSSSDSSSEEIEEEEDHFEEEEDEEDIRKKQIVSDHEFSPESDLEDGEEAAPTPVRRARTVKKVPEKDVSATSEEEDEVAEEKEKPEEDQTEDYPCKKCGHADHPEWILLCDKCDSGYHASCLRPPLMLIPEGDWFCPPCQHADLVLKLKETLRTFEKSTKKRENEELRRKRLAYVGISLANVLPTTEKTHSHHRRQVKSSSEYSSSEESESSDEEPVYQLRQRRTTFQTNYRFNDYDELINSAIQDEMEAVKGAGNLGRGKDIDNIVEAEKSEGASVEAAKEADGGDKPDENDDEEEGENWRPRVVPRNTALPSSRKKAKKLTDLDMASDGDDGSDEDFKGSSAEEEYSSSDADDSGDSIAKIPVRRSSRTRVSRIDKEFINDDSESSDEPRKKKKRKLYASSSSDSSDWGRRKRKSKSFNRIKSFRTGRRKAKKYFDSDSDRPKKAKPKRPKIRYGLSEDEDDGPIRRTRGKKVSYLDVQGSDTEEEVIRKSRKLPSEDEDEFVPEKEDEEEDEKLDTSKEKNRSSSDEDEDVDKGEDENDKDDNESMVDEKNKEDSCGEEDFNQEIPSSPDYQMYFNQETPSSPDYQMFNPKTNRTTDGPGPAVIVEPVKSAELLGSRNDSDDNDEDDDEVEEEEIEEEIEEEVEEEEEEENEMEEKIEEAKDLAVPKLRVVKPAELMKRALVERLPHVAIDVVKPPPAVVARTEIPQVPLPPPPTAAQVPPHLIPKGLAPHPALAPVIKTEPQDLKREMKEEKKDPVPTIRLVPSAKLLDPNKRRPPDESVIRGMLATGGYYRPQRMQPQASMPPQYRQRYPDQRYGMYQPPPQIPPTHQFYPAPGYYPPTEEYGGYDDHVDQPPQPQVVGGGGGGEEDGVFSGLVSYFSSQREDISES